MAGRGPAPKPAHRKAGHTRDVHGLRVIEAAPTTQPNLPQSLTFVDKDGKRTSVDIPEQTLTWWEMWASSPLSAEFTATDWSELLDTAVLHARFWLGEVRLAPEIRLRVAKFGATPEDRARLRITFAQADQAEDKTPARRPTRRPMMPLSHQESA